MQRNPKTKALRAKLAFAGAAFAIVGSGAVFAQDLNVEETVTIAIGNEPPYTELKPDGTLGGAGPDIDRAALEHSGFSNFSGITMVYGAMIPGIMADRVQMLSSGSLIITPERCEQVIFSEPVICNSDAFLVREDVPDFDSYAEAASLGVKLSMPSGAIQQQRALDAGVLQENIVLYPDGMSGVKMLQDGRIDAIALNDAGVIDLKTRSGDESLRTVMPVTDVGVSCAGAAFAKDDTALRDAYNSGLAELRASGALRDILTSYGLEAGAQLLDAAPPTAELCGQ